MTVTYTLTELDADGYGTVSLTIDKTSVVQRLCGLPTDDGGMLQTVLDSYAADYRDQLADPAQPKVAAPAAADMVGKTFTVK